MSESNQSAIVLTIDQISASLLGPYGNTSVETPQFNRIAASSLLFENALAHGVRLDEACDRWWGRNQNSEQEGLFERLRNSGFDSVLITDDAQVAEHPAADFDHVILLETKQVEGAATELMDTELAHFFAQATAWIDENFRPGTLVWCHSRGLAGKWDAPYTWRQQFAADEDPDPPTFIEAPAKWLEPDCTDPDELLGIQQAAAAQVRLVDHLLGFFFDTIANLDADPEPLLCFASPRGCALGEHGLVGAGEQLYNESIQVPLMICDGSTSKVAGARSQMILNAGELRTFVDRWLTQDLDAWHMAMQELDRVLPAVEPEYALLVSEEHEVLQTAAWKLIRSKMGGAELYVKPDDRFEVNDISDRCPGVVAQMIAVLDGLLAGESVDWTEELLCRA